MDASYLADELKKTAEVLGENFGGFTFSGGEPLMQAEFLKELSGKLKGYHLTIETSGYAEEDIFKSAIGGIDLVIMDIKLAREEKHIELTGVSNKKILKNFEILRKSGKPYIIRTPLIPGITDTEDNLKKIKEIIGDSTWEKLPYNKMAGAKYEMLGLKYPFKDLMLDS